jgi:amino acid transporter
VPWSAPVLAPVLVSAAMIAAGVWHLRREARGEPVAIGAAQWFGINAGAVVIVIAFAMDYGNIMAGGMPRRFHWPVFAAGMAIGVGSYAAAAARRSRAARNVTAATHMAEAAR